MATDTNHTYGIKRLSVNYKDEKSAEQISNYLEKLIKETKKSYSNISIVCIGTDRSIGDSFAPIIGLMLKDKKFNNVKVYGNIVDPVHAKNLHDTMKTIDIDNSLIIAIDASLSKVENVGNITVTEGYMIPGAGVGKDLGVVGDISIIGNVNVSCKGFEFASLHNTRLGLVYEMACQTTKGIIKALKNIEKSKNDSKTDCRIEKVS